MIKERDDFPCCLYSLYSVISRKCPPGPGRLKALRLVPMIRRNPIDFFQYMHRTYGTISHFHIFREHVYIIQEPDWIEQVLVARSKFYHKSPLYRELKRVVGNGLLTAEDEQWKRERRLLQPAFHAKRLQLYSTIMQEEAEAVSRRWSDRLAHQEFFETDLLSEMMELTFAIVGRCLFKTDLSAYTEQVKHSLDTVLVEITDRVTQLIPPPIWLPLSGHRRFFQSLAALEEVVQNLIRERTTNPTDDILSLMLQSVDEQGNPMSTKQIRDETLTLILAGHETTATALTWTFYLLDKNRESLLRAVEEASAMRSNHLEASFLRACFNEALRLYPPAWEIERRATTTHTIQTSSGEVIIPAKTNIAICIYMIHRDERFWPEPDRFQPERFLENRQYGFAYLPFGGGPRICIGNQFAINEAMIILSTLLPGFDIQALDDPDPAPLVTLRPRNGMPVRIRKRR